MERILVSDPRTNHQFLGTFPADQLPNVMPPQTSLAIVNCCNRGYPGEHWLALCKTGDTLEIFDSFGMNPNFYNLTGKLPASSVLTYSRRQLQSLHSTVCGHYCLYYCYYKARGYSLDDIISNFSHDYINNDDYVYNTVLNLFHNYFRY